MILNILADDVSNETYKRLIAIAIGTMISIVSFIVGRWLGRLKANREWQKKEFLTCFTVSVNIFADGYLKIRTVLEDTVETIFLSPVAIKKVLTAAKQCTVDQPILPIAPEDRWYLLNYVLNEVAEKFHEGQVRYDAGLPVTRVTYALFLTCEVVGPERIRKVRAMMIQRKYLEEFPYLDSLPQLEKPWHENRIKTLRKAVALYAREPDNFLMLEVCV